MTAVEPEVLIGGFETRRRDNNQTESRIEVSRGTVTGNVCLTVTSQGRAVRFKFDQSQAKNLADAFRRATTPTNIIGAG